MQRTVAAFGLNRLTGGRPGGIMGCMAKDDVRQVVSDSGNEWGDFDEEEAGGGAGDRRGARRTELTPTQREQIERQARQALDEAQIIASTRGQARDNSKLRDMEAAVQRTEKFAYVMDKWLIDPIAGAFVGVGDTVTAAAGLYVVAEALNAGVPAGKIFHMLVNIGIDFAFGAIPVVGDIFDFFYKSNKKNAQIFRDYFEKLQREESRSGRRRRRDRDEF